MENEQPEIQIRCGRGFAPLFSPSRSRSTTICHKLPISAIKEDQRHGIPELTLVRRMLKQYDLDPAVALDFGERCPSRWGMIIWPSLRRSKIAIRAGAGIARVTIPA